MKKFFKITFFMAFILCLGIVAEAKIYYVDSKSGSGDGSVEKPFSTVQAAANIVEPGDTVLIKPGIYYEQVDIKRCGTEDKPIVFRAESNNKNDVIISGANKEIREGRVKWTLEDAEKNIWSVPYDTKCSVMLYNGNWIDQTTSMDVLKTLRDSSGNIWPNDVFTYDEKEKKIYLRLRKDEKYASANPNENTMCLSGPYYKSVLLNGKEDSAFNASGISKGSYCMGVVTEAPAYITIYGITFESPGEAGVYIRGSNVRVSNCWFVGCSTGVRGGSRSQYDLYYSNDITIEHCDWNMFPLFENKVEILKTHMGEYLADSSGFSENYAWYNKLALRNTPNTVVKPHETGGVFAFAGNNWTLRNCHTSSCFDALSSCHSIVGFVEYPGTNKLVAGQNYHYYENRFENSFDNAVEFEECGQNYNVHNNEFMNNYTVISLQSFQKPFPTNIRLHHNQFEEEQWLTDMRNQLLSGSTWLKIGHSLKYASYTNRMAQEFDDTNGVAIKPTKATDQGFAIYNNSVYMPQAYSTGIVQDILPGQMYFYNNILYCRMQSNPVWKRTFIQPGNFLSSGYSGELKEGNMYIPSNPDASEPDLTSQNYNKGFFFRTLEDAKVNWDGEILTLAEGSVGIDKGVQVPWEEKDINYIGAVPYGEKWHIDYGVYPYGDTNCDNKINLSDLSKIATLKGEKEGTEGYKNRCDMNFDGIIDEKDIETWLVQAYNGGGK